MSTMAVYGEEGELEKDVVINSITPVNPKTYYAISKVEAEIELRKLSDDIFKIAILRAPIIYGPKCPGNYAKLEKLASILPIFPMIVNKRSMLHINKLCILVKEYIDEKVEGIYLPQDEEYINTSLMVKEIAAQKGKSVYLSEMAGKFVTLIGKRCKVIKKVFGNLVYEK